MSTNLTPGQPGTVATPPPASTLADKCDCTVDLARVVAQVAIVAGAMLLVYLALSLSLNKWTPAAGELKASDVVAILGAVTTFLGTAIGLFFGVAVRQSGKKSADEAAKTAHDTARVASGVTQQAQAISSQAVALANQAQTAATVAAAQTQTYQAQLESLRARFSSKAEQLRDLASPIHATRASAILSSAVTGTRPSNASIQQMVYDIVCNQIVKLGGEKTPEDVDTSRKVSADPPEGYGLVGQYFNRFCIDCVNQINSECESSVDPNDATLRADVNRTLDSFINDATQAAINHPA